MAQLGGGRGGLLAWPEPKTVDANGSLVAEDDSKAANWGVFVATQAVVQLCVKGSDSGDSGLVAFHLGGRGQDTRDFPTVADIVLNVRVDGTDKVIRQAILNVMPYAQLTVLKVVNSNSNAVAVNAELAFTH